MGVMTHFLVRIRSLSTLKAGRDELKSTRGCTTDSLAMRLDRSREKSILAQRASDTQFVQDGMMTRFSRRINFDSLMLLAMAPVIVIIVLTGYLIGQCVA